MILKIKSLLYLKLVLKKKLNYLILLKEEMEKYSKLIVMRNLKIVSSIIMRRVWRLKKTGSQKLTLFKVKKNKNLLKTETNSSNQELKVPAEFEPNLH